MVYPIHVLIINITFIEMQEKNERNVNIFFGVV